MRLLFVTTDWNTPHRIATGEYGGVGYYRAHGPAKELRKRGHEVDVMGHDISEHIDREDMVGSYKRLFEKYDVVIIKQADTANAGKLIGGAKEAGTPIVMDLDDLILELDKDNPAYEMGYSKGDAKQAMAIAALSMVDAVFTSTQPLADEYTAYMKKTFKTDLPAYVLPNACDAELWSKRQLEDNHPHFIIGWQGSISHDGDIKLMLPALKKLMKKYPDIAFSMTGGLRQETYDNVFKRKFKGELLERIVSLPGTQSFLTFPLYLSKHQWDIGIAPLRHSRFNVCKSHIKWLENSLIGVPTIASAVYPYMEPIQGVPVIEHGKTGLLAKDGGEWLEHIEALYTDERKRFYMARDANEYVKEHWQYKHHIHKWEAALEEVLSAGSKGL